MRPLPLAVLILLAAPLTAQARPAQPAPSVLFAPTEVDAVAYTTHRRTGLSVIEGGGLGAAAGIIMGAAFGSYMASSHPCSCDDPGLEPFAYGFLSGLVGFVVGASLADEKQQEEAHPSVIRVPETAVTENGTPLTADSTRLVGRDPHGVRGGIAGALIGGAIGYGTTNLVYSIAHPHSDVLYGSDGPDRPSGLVVWTGTLSGALSGYLIGAMLSKR